MRLLTNNDVPRTGIDRTYAYSPWSFLACAVVGFAFAGAAMYQYFVGEGSILLWVAVLGGVGIAVLCLISARNTMRPANWVLRTGPDGLYVKFGGYFRGDAIQETHPTVAYFHHTEIDAVGVTRTLYRLPGREGATESETISSLDVVLNHGDTGALAEALAEERRNRIETEGTAANLEFPVRLAAPGIVRIHWKVQPPLSRAVLELADCYPLRPDETVTWPAWEQLDGEQREALIREIAQQGELMLATRLATNHFELDKAEADRIVKGWMAEPAFTTPAGR